MTLVSKRIDYLYTFVKGQTFSHKITQMNETVTSEYIHLAYKNVSRIKSHDL